MTKLQSLWDELTSLDERVGLESPAREILDETQKTQEEWNGEGTFHSLETLKDMNDAVIVAEGLRGLSWRADDD